MPESIPAFDPRKTGWYDKVAFRIVSSFVGDDIPVGVLIELIADAYDSFTNRAVAPLKQLDDRLWLMELFHGPTLAFKDVALQLLGQMFSYVLQRQDRRVTIVGATSGDTGSAAIEAFRGSKHADIFIMLPHGRVSDVQRRQMTTVDAPNVHVLAVEGSFDDCQDIVKALFADRAFRERVSLSAVNSINWARIMAQIVYYAVTSQAFDGKRVDYVVPSGNFGNAYAGHMARRMGAMVGNITLAQQCQRRADARRPDWKDQTRHCRADAEPGDGYPDSQQLRTAVVRALRQRRRGVGCRHDEAAAGWQPDADEAATRGIAGRGSPRRASATRRR